MNDALDQRPIPDTLPAELRKAIAIAAELRSDPVLLGFAEAIVAAQAGQSLGTPLDFSDSQGERFRQLMADPPAEFVRAVNTAGARISPLAAAMLLAQARRIEFDPAAHLRAISDQIAAAISGRGKKRIAISMPPRHGKSTLVSRRTPEFFLAGFPHLACGIIGYNESFAETWGRLVRNDLLDTPESFGFGLSPDSTAASRWATAHGGGLWSAGVGGSITGRNANLLIIDDPIRGFAEAASARERDELWSWFLSTALTRMERDSVLLLVMTRWHSNDLIGRIKANQADDWSFIELPAVCELDRDRLGRKRGDPLWPAKFGPAELELTKRSVGDETWSALYQCVPVDETVIGRAYHSFSDANIRECAFDERCQVCVSFDFNHDPGTCVILQCREYWGDRAYLTNARFQDFEVLREISIGDSNTRVIAEEADQVLRTILAGRAPVKIKVYGDASGNSMRSSASQSDWDIVRETFANSRQFYHATFDIPEANPGVRDRVNAVCSLLQTADRRIRLYIDPSCRQLIADLRQCRWRRDSNGNSTSQIDKSDPRRTHASDALGYCIHRRTKVGEQVFGLMPGLLQ